MATERKMGEPMSHEEQIASYDLALTQLHQRVAELERSLKIEEQKYQRSQLHIEELTKNAATLAGKAQALADVIGELRNFELNGSDAVKQIRGIYSDLESATQEMIKANRKAKKLETALEELEGFAKRNVERARKAADQFKRNQDKHSFRQTWEAEARYHEAVRFYQVIKLRVAEARHEQG